MLDIVPAQVTRPCVSMRAPGTLAEAIRHHPVLQLLPQAACAVAHDHGTLRQCAPGEIVDLSDRIGFVVQGYLATFDANGLACVAHYAPGAMFGLETALTPGASVRLLGMVESVWIDLPASSLSREMGLQWVEHVFARHALGRLTRLQADAACNAVHQIPQRLANLIRRLHTAEGREIRTTQTILGQALGVQRTSVNAALKVLERDGALRLGRGRLIVLDPGKLGRFACGC